MFKQWTYIIYNLAFCSPINLKGLSAENEYPKMPHRITRMAFLDVPVSHVILFNTLCRRVRSSSSAGPIRIDATTLNNYEKYCNIKDYGIIKPLDKWLHVTTSVCTVKISTRSKCNWVILLFHFANEMTGKRCH